MRQVAGSNTHVLGLLPRAAGTDFLPVTQDNTCSVTAVVCHPVYACAAAELADVDLERQRNAHLPTCARGLRRGDFAVVA